MCPWYTNERGVECPSIPALTLGAEAGVDDGLNAAWLNNEDWVLYSEDGRQTQRDRP